MNTAFSPWNNVMQQNPDLMQIKPMNYNHGKETVQLSVLLRANADSEHKSN